VSTASEFRRKSGNPGKSVPVTVSDDRSAETGNGLGAICFLDLVFVVVPSREFFVVQLVSNLYDLCGTYSFLDSFVVVPSKNMLERRISRVNGLGPVAFLTLFAVAPTRKF
jgi:hypothetical protein